jgi:hypothetical protein
MQSYTSIQATDSITNGRQELLNNDLTVMSQSSGTAFPTSNLQIGMPCFRTDLNQIYALQDLTPTWIKIMDLSTGFAPGGFGLGTVAEICADLNSLLTSGSGFYRGNALTHAPDTGWWFIIHTAHDLTSWASQLIISYGTAGSYPAGTVMSRICVAGTWSSWSQLFTTAGGNMTGAINETSVTLASSSNLAIGAAAGNFIQVTGTTSISLFDTIQAGTKRVLRFASPLTINNSANIVLPNNANLNVNAGDAIEVISLGSGNWVCTDYTHYAGYLPNTGGNMSGAINEAIGTSIASAATTNIGAATGNFVQVTGTTTITGLGTVQAGTRRIVEFLGNLILTYNSTSLILPSAANINTAVGDTAEFVSLGSGNWLCVNYNLASGKSLISSGSVLFTGQIGSAIAATCTASAGVTTLSLTGVTSNGTFKAAQVIYVGADTQAYTIQANVTASGTTATISIYPCLQIAATGASLNLAGNVFVPPAGTTANTPFWLNMAAPGGGGAVSTGSGTAGGTTSFGAFASCSGGGAGTTGSDGAAGGVNGTPGKGSNVHTAGNSYGGSSLFGHGGTCDIVGGFYVNPSGYGGGGAGNSYVGCGAGGGGDAKKTFPISGITSNVTVTVGTPGVQGSGGYTGQVGGPGMVEVIW